MNENASKKETRERKQTVKRGKGNKMEKKNQQSSNNKYQFLRNECKKIIAVLFHVYISQVKNTEKYNNEDTTPENIC